MSELKDLLLDTVNGINQRHTAALSDLRQCVAEADEAAKAVSSDFIVRLGDATFTDRGASYPLVIGRKNLSHRIGDFFVRLHGYPLKFEAPGAGQELGDAEALRKFFRDMMVNANSPFVAQLAYLLRK